MELVEKGSFEAVLSCWRTACPAARVPGAASGAPHVVTNANGMFFRSLGKQRKTLHTESRTPVPLQNTAISCVLRQGTPRKKAAGGLSIMADYSACNNSCFSSMSYRSNRCAHRSASPSTRPDWSSSSPPLSISSPSVLFYDDYFSSSQSSTSHSPPLLWFSFPLAFPPLWGRRLEAEHALRRRDGIQAGAPASCSSLVSSRRWLPPPSDAGTDHSDDARDAVSVTVSSPTRRRVGPSAQGIGPSAVCGRTASSEAVHGSLHKHLLRITCYTWSSCCSNYPSWRAKRLGSFSKPHLCGLQQQRYFEQQQQQHPGERPQPWLQQRQYADERRQRQRHPWEEQHHWQQQQRRWYTPPSRRNWSKQHNKIFTRRPLTDNFALGRLHPELEWFRERASQPVSLFMGFPDLEKIHVRGGASYINEMDAATLSIVLAAIGSQGRTSAASPAHLPQHNSPLIEQLGFRAATLAATTPDPTLAYLFRGCAAAGVSGWATVCTLVGYIDTRLPRFSVHDVLVVLQGIRMARAGSLQHFVDDADVERTPLSPVYVHVPFVDRVVRHLELLLQHRDDVLPVELCAAATLLAGLGYASAARMQFLSGLLAQVPQQQLALTPPGALAAAMEVFARHRAELNVDCRHFSQTNCPALPPLLRAAAAPPGLEPSRTQLTLIFLVAPLLHRLQTGAGAGGASAARNGRRASRSCRAGGASPAAAAGGSTAAAARRSLSEAAATAAAAAAEERSEVRRRGSLLRHAVGICLAWAYERLEDLSVHYISKALYAATAARLYPAGPFMEDLFKASLEQLDACTPADLSRLLYAILRAGEPGPSADPALLQARVRIQHALDISLETCSSSTLVRVLSAVATALARTTDTLHARRPSQQHLPASSERLVSATLLAQKAALFLSARLLRARPGDLVTFLVGLRTVKIDNGDSIAEKIFEIIDPCLQVLEPAQLASLLAVVAEPPCHHGIRRRESTSRLLASLKVNLVEGRQHWQPETCLQILLSLSRLPEEWKDLVHPLAVAVCDRLVSTEGLRSVGRKDPTQQDPADAPHDGYNTSSDAFGGKLAAVSKEGMPSDELRTFSHQMSPLQWLGIGHYKQLLHALEDLQVRHKQLREVVTQVVAMKRHDFTNTRHVREARTLRTW